MNWSTVKPWAGLAARLLLGAIWIWASLSKLAHPLRFVQAVRAYEMTPEWLSQAIGYGLPVLEFCLGVVLVVGVTVRIAAATSGALLIVFLIGVLSAWGRGLSIDCGCFGGGGQVANPSYLLDALRDLGLLVVAGYLVVWSRTPFSIEWYLARHDHVEMPSAKRMRTEAGRKRYEAQVAAARAAARSRTLYVDGAMVLVVALVSLIGIGVQAGRANLGSVTVASNMTIAHGVVYGKKAAATVDIYEDFGCPACRAFEQATHAQLEKDVRANLAQVRYHPIAILDGSSPNRYSTRSANAAICVSDESIDAFVRYHDILYGTVNGIQVQPVEGTAGPSNAQLITYAKQLKLSSTQQSALASCIDVGTYDPLVAKLTDTASRNGISSTPTIKVNGRTLKDHSATSFFAAIAAADAKGPKPSPSPSQSPSPTPSGTTVSPSATRSSSGTRVGLAQGLTRRGSAPRAARAGPPRGRSGPDRRRAARTTCSRRPSGRCRR